MLLARAATYTRRLGLGAAYIAVGDYAASEAMVAGRLSKRDAGTALRA